VDARNLLLIDVSILDLLLFKYLTELLSWFFVLARPDYWSNSLSASANWILNLDLLKSELMFNPFSNIFESLLLYNDSFLEINPC